MHSLISQSHTFPSPIPVYMSVMRQFTFDYTLLSGLCHMLTKASCDTAVLITPILHMLAALSCARGIFWKPWVWIILKGWSHRHRHTETRPHATKRVALVLFAHSIHYEESHAKCMFCHIKRPFFWFTHCLLLFQHSPYPPLHTHTHIYILIYL